MYFIHVCILQLLLSSTSCLKCTQCSSQKSMDQCKEESVSVTCSENQVCFTASYELYGDLKFVRKGCSNKECDPLLLCGSPSKCKYSCCNGSNNCNASWALLPNVRIIVLCGFVFWLTLRRE